MDNKYQKAKVKTRVEFRLSKIQYFKKMTKIIKNIYEIC